jgi:hypothetical protein
MARSQPGQAGTQKDPSRKHEMAKPRKPAKKIFVFSNFRVFVINNFFFNFFPDQLQVYAENCRNLAELV